MNSSDRHPCVAEVVVRYLADQGVGHVFLVPGRQIDPLVAGLIEVPGVIPVVANHELAAGYMADGYARASGGIGVSFAIGGPGSANLIGAAMAAKADGSPVLFITGNIPASGQGQGKFQDAGPAGSNDIEIFRATTGISLCCARPDDLAPTLSCAMAHLTDRQPVHVAIAEDIQALKIDIRHDMRPVIPLENKGIDRLPISEVAPKHDWLAQGRALLVVDNGALSIASTITAAAQALALPVATDIHARGIVSEEGAHAAGHLGFMAHPRTGAALDNGSPLRAERVIAIGCGDHLLNTLKGVHGRVNAISTESFSAWWMATPTLPDPIEQEDRHRWLSELAMVCRPEPPASTRGADLSYAQVVDAVTSSMPSETTYVVDAGQVRRVAVARLRCRQHGRLLVADGMAPMGWSLGAAVGAQLARPNCPVVALLGDGSMRMHGIELATAARYNLPILYVLFANNAYGTVLARADTQEGAETARLPQVNWNAFAQAFGVEAVYAEDLFELKQALAVAPCMRAPRLIVVPVPAIDLPAATNQMDSSALFV